MGYYGNNLGALVTGGVLVYVDEPTAGQVEDTEFDSLLLADRDIFLDTFGVSATYQPGVLNRSITVIVRYIEDAAQVLAGGRKRSPVINIKAANDPAAGISADEFEPGQLISVSPRKGSDARSFRLAVIVKQSAAFVTYECH